MAKPQQKQNALPAVDSATGSEWDFKLTDQGGPQRVLVIDDDEAARKALVKIVKDLGAVQTETCETSDQGWAAIKSRKFDLIVLDWKLEPVNGAVILHRVRALHQSQDVPVLMISSAITKKDFRFADEYFLCSLLEKPLDANFLRRRIKDLMKDRQWLDEQIVRIQAHIAAHADDSVETATALVPLILEAPRPVPLGLAIARHMFESGRLVAARTICEAIIGKDVECAAAHTLLGKIHLAEGNAEESLKSLATATDMFPSNPERVALTGDVYLTQLEFEDANRVYDEALGIDPQNERATNGKHLASNASDFLRSMDLSKPPPSFAALLNAIGIHMVRQREFEKGIAHYQSAMQFVTLPDTQARLAFNLGLGYARWQKNSDAVSWLQRAVQLSGGTLTKARNWLDRLNIQVDEPMISPGDFDVAEERFDGSEPALPITKH